MSWKGSPSLLLALFSFVLNQNQSLVLPRLFLFLLLISEELLTVFRKEKIVGSRELSTVQFSVVSGESVCFTFYVFIVIMSVYDRKGMCATGPR